MLAKWVGKLTWDALVAKVELELGIKTTRQTLCTYVGINTYYKNKKAELRGATPSLYTKITASELKLVEQIEHLKAEVAVLKRNNAEQLRMIERMLLNANAIPNLDLYALVKKRPEEIHNS
ncbi:hypothetical protein ACM7QE_04160 [Pseudomonas aeruginosa]|uniref:hypothetical protein n=1 Tax=Pseudomonas aeruginosa TaxID=287 RepID=UPI0007274E82|nr:hypothetical protein [Pseudomonas aeruginosa]KSK68398.1 hypothetical protein APA34_30070 [Pseudomonas aeruginosa]MCS7927067.1 hypothetical protein [Pseudomonas aeruginosa]